MRHIINIHGEITEDSYKRFKKQVNHIYKLKVEEPDQDREVSIDLMSDGGCLYSALAYCATIRCLKDSGVSVIIKAKGMVASSAVLILSYGSERIMMKESWVMLHESTLEGLEGDDLTKITQETKHLETLEKQYAELLASNSKTSYDTWRQLNKGVTYLSASQCLELGLVDRIL